MYKITRKRVVRQVREKATSYRGARVRENVTHNATITGMDRHENVLVVSNESPLTLENPEVVMVPDEPPFVICRMRVCGVELAASVNAPPLITC